MMAKPEWGSTKDKELQKNMDATKQETSFGKRSKIKNKHYEKELFRLQLELVKLQRWIVDEGLKVVVVFEGRDAAGKGGVIKRITEYLSVANYYSSRDRQLK